MRASSDIYEHPYASADDTTPGELSRAAAAIVAVVGAAVAGWTYLH
jgi:hypothetical protein